MCFVIFDFVSELIDQIVDEVVESEQTCFEGLQSVDIRLFQELVVEIGVAYFVIQVNLNIVAPSLESHDSFERVWNELFKLLDSQLVVGESIILLNISLLDSFHSLEQILKLFLRYDFTKIDVSVADWPFLEFLNVMF